MKNADIFIFKTPDRAAEVSMLKRAVRLLAEKYNLKIWDSGTAIPGVFIDLILKNTQNYSDAHFKMLSFLEPKFLKFKAGSVLYITLAGGIDLHQATVQKISTTRGFDQLCQM